METIYSYVETSESNVIPTKDLTQNIKKAVGNKIFTVNIIMKKICIISIIIKYIQLNKLNCIFNLYLKLDRPP